VAVELDRVVVDAEATGVNDLLTPVSCHAHGDDGIAAVVSGDGGDDTCDEANLIVDRMVNEHVVAVSKGVPVMPQHHTTSTVACARIQASSVVRLGEASSLHGATALLAVLPKRSDSPKNLSEPSSHARNERSGSLGALPRPARTRAGRRVDRS